MDTYGVTVHLVADQALERVSVVFFPLGEFSRQSCHLSLGSNVKEADLKNLLLLLSSLCATWTCIFLRCVGRRFCASAVTWDSPARVGWGVMLHR